MPGAATARADLRDLATRWVELGWRRGDADAVLALYAPDFVDLGHPGGRPGTAAENVAGIRDLYAAFPDFAATVEALIADEAAAAVAVRWTATGTHAGPFLGVPPTGRTIRFTGIETLRVRHGLIVERAGEWDALAILRQLGVAIG